MWWAILNVCSVVGFFGIGLLMFSRVNSLLMSLINCMFMVILFLMFVYFNQFICVLVYSFFGVCLKNCLIWKGWMFLVLMFSLLLGYCFLIVISCIFVFIFMILLFIQVGMLNVSFFFLQVLVSWWQWGLKMWRLRDLFGKVINCSGNKGSILFMEFGCLDFFVIMLFIGRC